MSSPDAPPDEPQGFVQSLSRGLSVIRAFDGTRPSLSLSEVAERTHLSRATARRFLLTLEHLGYVKVEARAFALTPQVLDLGVSYLSSLGLPEIAQPHLEALSEHLGESVSAAILDGGDIIYVARAAARRLMSVRISVGTRFPAHATAMGRVLISGLPEATWQHALTTTGLARLTSRTVTDTTSLIDILHATLRQGWTEVDGELEDGLRSVAVPVHGAYGVEAAINVATGSRSAAQTTALVAALTETARDIENDLRRVALAPYARTP